MRRSLRLPPGGSFRSWVSGGRQLNPKSAPFAQLRLESKLGAHAFRGFPNDGEADARSLVVAGGVDPLEHPENPVVVFRGDADPVIFHPNPNGAVGMVRRRRRP